MPTTNLHSYSRRRQTVASHVCCASEPSPPRHSEIHSSYSSQRLSKPLERTAQFCYPKAWHWELHTNEFSCPTAHRFAWTYGVSPCGWLRFICACSGRESKATSGPQREGRMYRWPSMGFELVRLPQAALQILTRDFNQHFRNQRPTSALRSI
jgi:hypothetical protein